MAVVYFTNNASTGAGSLAEAVANAQPGDVVRPDETVFERGSTIEIVLVGTLAVDKNLTLDGGPFRVALNGGGSVACAAVANGATVDFTAFDFIGGATSQNGGGLNVERGAAVVLSRCRVCGCDAAQYGGGIYVGDNAALTANDSAIYGSRAQYGGGVYVGDNAALTFNGATVCGNVDANAGLELDGETSASTLAAVNSILGNAFDDAATLGCVVGVAPSAIGFVASPPDDLTVETWDANAWQNWDLRLLDDASPNPSPYRDSGDVDSMSQYDVEGNFRGRETDGATTCSPGAYETIQADLFWIGKDATGAEVASPSWVNANGWAASRFATVSGDVAPQNDDVVFIDGSITFDGNVLRLGKLVVGGGASLSVDNSSGATLTVVANQFDLGVGSTLRSVGSSTLRFQIGRAVLVSRFGDWVNIQSQFLLGEAAGLEIAPTAKFTTVVSSVKLYANGFYVNYNLQITNVATVEGDSSGCENVYVSFQKPTARIAANGTPRVACGLVKWTPPTDATSDFTGLADGSTPVILAPSRTATVVGLGCANDFAVDVSNAQTSSTPLALTLTGQTVYGDAPTGSAVSLTGSAKVDEHGLTSQLLTLTADATLSVDSGSVYTETLTLADGVNVKFSGTDAVLTATETATVGAATFTGTGYFASPHGTDISYATFVETVRACDYGAGVSLFNASPASATSALLSWVKQNSTPSVLIEEANGNGWNVVNDRATGDSLSIDISAPKTFRLFDGENFFTASARPYGTAYELAEEQTIGYLKTLISTGYLN